MDADEARATCPTGRGIVRVPGLPPSGHVIPMVPGRDRTTATGRTTVAENWSRQPEPGGISKLSWTALGLGSGGLILGVALLGGWYFGLLVSPKVTAFLAGALGVGGVVVGPVALGDCERNGRRGSLTAIAGLVAGALALAPALLAVLMALLSRESYAVVD